MEQPEELTFSPEASRSCANPSLKPEGNAPLTTTAISGRNLRDLFESSSPGSACSRMLRESSIWRVGLTGYTLTWKRKGTKFGRTLYLLRLSERRTAATASGLPPSPPTLFQSPMPSDVDGGRTTKGRKRQRETGLRGQAMLFPTPAANDPGIRAERIVDRDGNIPIHPNQRLYDKHTGRLVQDGLSQFVELWPTPRASASENRTTKPTPSQLAGTHGKYLAAEVLVAEQLLSTPQASELTNDLTLTCSGDGRHRPNKLGWAVAEAMTEPGGALEATPRSEGFDAGGHRGATDSLHSRVKAGAALEPTPRPCSGERSSGANRTELYEWMAENPPTMLHTPTSKANQDTPSMRERDPGSWFGTPTAAMKRRSPEHAAGRAKNPKEIANELLPTATAHDAQDTGAPSEAERKSPDPATSAGAGNKTTGLKLSAEFVAWLMGFPRGYLDLED